MSDQEKESWHLDKKVPIALILAIFSQALAFGWWASALSFRVTRLEEDRPVTTSEIGKLEDAREKALISLTQLNDKVDQILVFVKTIGRSEAPH